MTHKDGELLCMPHSCDLSDFTPTDTPATECIYNFERSAETHKVIFEVLKDVDEYNATIECIRSKMEIVVPNKEAVCFYIGFKPENEYSQEKLHDELRKDGYT